MRAESPSPKILDLLKKPSLRVGAGLLGAGLVEYLCPSAPMTLSLGAGVVLAWIAGKVEGLWSDRRPRAINRPQSPQLPPKSQ
jgi:hypothetical protein